MFTQKIKKNKITNIYKIPYPFSSFAHYQYLNTTYQALFFIGAAYFCIACIPYIILNLSTCNTTHDLSVFCNDIMVKFKTIAFQITDKKSY